MMAFPTCFMDILSADQAAGQSGHGNPNVHRAVNISFLTGSYRGFLPPGDAQTAPGALTGDIFVRLGSTHETAKPPSREAASHTRIH